MLLLGLICGLMALPWLLIAGTPLFIFFVYLFMGAVGAVYFFCGMLERTLGCRQILKKNIFSRWSAPALIPSPPFVYLDLVDSEGLTCFEGQSTSDREFLHVLDM